MNFRQKIAHMKVAKIYADLSYCQRRKVGCVIVKGNKVISIGYNGTPAGEDNCCEENNVTKPNVIHAEDNALRKIGLFESTNAVMFVTTAPCCQCAVKIIKSGIKEVYFCDEYNHADGIQLLVDNKINVERLEVNG